MTTHSHSAIYADNIGYLMVIDNHKAYITTDTLTSVSNPDETFPNVYTRAFDTWEFFPSLYHLLNY